MPAIAAIIRRFFGEARPRSLSDGGSPCAQAPAPPAFSRNDSAALTGSAVIACARALPVRWFLVAAIAGIVFYLAFLVTVDVPMYLGRWRAGREDGSKPLGVLEGLRDVRTRWVVTHDITHWKGEIAWMSLYFSLAVWASLALCAAYSLDNDLPRYRTDAASISFPSPALARAASSDSLLGAFTWWR